MATNDTSIADLLKSAVRDAQDLVRGEIALAKAEARDEVSRLGTGVALLAGALVAALIGVVMMTTALAWAIAEVLAWPVWSGFAIVTLLLLLAAGALAIVGRRRITARRHMPNTVDTLKENMEWMRARTS
jgi:hypothetical protein